MFFIRSFAQPLAVAVLLISPLATIAWCDDSNDSDFLRKERPAVEAREKRIVQELANLNRRQLKADDWAKEWAGTYFTGDGLGENVTISIAPKSGITYTNHGCAWYEANHGEIVAATPESLEVNWSVDPDKFAFISSRLYFVRWGLRKYLVPERKMRDLITQYNGGGLGRETLMFIPLRFEGKPVFDAGRRNPGPPGRPELPAQFAKFIIDKPARLTITKVTIKGKRPLDTDMQAIEAEVKLDGGQDSGLVRGMVIQCDVNAGCAEIVLSEVNERTSRGIMSAMLYDKSGRLPTVGSHLILPGAKPESQDKPDPPKSR